VAGGIDLGLRATRGYQRVGGLANALSPYLYLPDNAMPRFKAALAASATGRAEILVVGDSIAQGASATNWLTGNWPAVLRDGLQASYGGTSRGLLFVSYSPTVVAGLSDPHIVYTPTGTWVRGYNGHSGCSLNTSVAGDFVTATGVMGDALKLLFVGNGVANAYSVTVNIDGLDKETYTVSTYAYAPIVRSYAGLGAGPHTVVVTANTNGKPHMFNGIVAYTGTTGVVVHNAGISGNRASSFYHSSFINDAINPTAQNGGQLAYNQTLTIIALGTNEPSVPTTSEDYHKFLSQLADACVAKGSDMLFISHGHSSLMANHELFYRYPAVMRTVAMEYGSPWVSMFGLHHYNDETWRVPSGFYANATDVHLTSAGHQNVAATVRAVIDHYCGA
jgi:lysophospholipase L1-like esterase